MNVGKLLAFQYIRAYYKIMRERLYFKQELYDTVTILVK